ncbi:hypothetical protein RV05_GL000480 [Enterococcus hirae]|nr:hypothetical protein RV05_GL000480 [Enterococcus hirae]
MKDKINKIDTTFTIIAKIRKKSCSEKLKTKKRKTWGM